MLDQYSEERERAKRVGGCWEEQVDKRMSQFLFWESGVIILITESMSKENKNWTPQEDQALLQLRETRGIQKWSIICKTMQEEFKIMGKSGKKCRERYFYHLDAKVKREEWSGQEEALLLQLHNERGNKWVQIAKLLERTDNDVKNHFHSKLRKALRKINLFLIHHLREFKPLKNNIISKILQTAEQNHQHPAHQGSSTAKLCHSLKNRILAYLDRSDQQIVDDLTTLRTMVKEINHFNKVFKKKGSSKNDLTREKIQPSRRRIPQIPHNYHQTSKSQQSGPDSDLADQDNAPSPPQPRIQTAIPAQQAFVSHSQPHPNLNSGPPPYPYYRLDPFYSVPGPFSHLGPSSCFALPYYYPGGGLANCSLVRCDWEWGRWGRGECGSGRHVRGLFEWGNGGSCFCQGDGRVD